MAKGAKKKEGVPESKEMGRPKEYTQEIADKICEQISTSNKSLRTICLPDEMPAVRTVLYWLNNNEDFLRQYTRAKEEQADWLVEEMLEIADNKNNDTFKTEDGKIVENKDVVNRSRLQVDTRKWIAAHLKPKRYGDKQSVELTGKDGKDLFAGMTEEQLDARIKALMGK